MAGIYGADVANPVSVAGWQGLMKERGVTFGIVRCYESTGKVDPNGPTTVKNGWTAKLSGVDVYHFPSLSVSAETQVSQAVAALQEAGATFGTYWIDVEKGAGWSTTDRASNASFLASLVAAAEQQGLTVGIYTSVYEWSTIINTAAFASYPLWYAQYQTPPQASFAGFTPFGGWTQPAMKQFAGNESYGGVSYDGNWMPGPSAT
jgi:GH25 family lysozyme M1 (1,4-beta-N-acetylmuramidase)